MRWIPLRSPVRTTSADSLISVYREASELGKNLPGALVGMAVFGGIYFQTKNPVFLAIVVILCIVILLKILEDRCIVFDRSSGRMIRRSSCRFIFTLHYSENPINSFQKLAIRQEVRQNEDDSFNVYVVSAEGRESRVDLFESNSRAGAQGLVGELNTFLGLEVAEGVFNPRVFPQPPGPSGLRVDRNEFSASVCDKNSSKEALFPLALAGAPRRIQRYVKLFLLFWNATLWVFLAAGTGVGFYYFASWLAGGPIPAAFQDLPGIYLAGFIVVWDAGCLFMLWQGRRLKKLFQPVVREAGPAWYLEIRGATWRSAQYAEGRPNCKVIDSLAVREIHVDHENRIVAELPGEMAILTTALAPADAEWLRAALTDLMGARRGQQ